MTQMANRSQNNNISVYEISVQHSPEIEEQKILFQLKETGYMRHLNLTHKLDNTENISQMDLISTNIQTSTTIQTYIELLNS